MASKRFLRVTKILTGAVADTEDEIFQLEGRLERFVHFWALVIRHFVRNRCLIRASALSYSTLLALIPLLAVAIGVTSSLLKNQSEEKFYDAIDKVVSSMTPPPPPEKMVLLQTNFNAGLTNSFAPTNPPASSPSNVFSADATAFTSSNSVTAPTNLISAVLTAVASTNSAEAKTESRVNAQKEIAHKIRDFVQNTQSATLGVTGTILLVFIAISMLSRVEDTFNDIWGVTRGRNWLWRVVLYWTTITLGPLLLFTALGLSSSSRFQNVQDYFHHMPVVGKLIFGIIPLVLLWLTFALIYRIVPNTRVHTSAAMIGGLVAGTLWHLNNVFSFLFVSRFVTYSNLYGKLGLVPVFMIGIYFSWVILLFGAQVAYAFQNRAAYLQDRLAENVNQRGREFVALRIMTSLGHRFQNGLRPANVGQLSAELGIPSRLTQSVLRTLTNTQLVTEVGSTEAAFVPARPLENITAYDILSAMRTGNGQELPMLQEPALTAIYGEFARIERAEREAASSISMLALVGRTPPPALGEPEILPPEKTKAAPKLEKFSAPPEKNWEPADVELKTESAPEKIPEDKIMRRETVQPGEETDFPL